MDINIDRVILAEVQEFFRNTTQTNWGKNQIGKKIEEISKEVIDKRLELLQSTLDRK